MIVYPVKCMSYHVPVQSVYVKISFINNKNYLITYLDLLEIKTLFLATDAMSREQPLKFLFLKMLIY